MESPVGIGHARTIGLAVGLVSIWAAIATAQPSSEARPVLHPSPGPTAGPRPAPDIKPSQDYMAVAKADLERGQQYMRKVGAEIMVLAEQLEALAPQVDRNTYLNPAGNIRLSSKQVRDFVDGLKKRYQAALEESDKWLGPVMTSMDLTVNQRPNRPYNMIREIDRMEFSIIESMQTSAAFLWDAYAQQASWERLVFQAQIEETHERMSQPYRAEDDAAWKVLMSEVWKNGNESYVDKAVGDAADNKYAATVGPACRRANEEDLAYIPQVATSLQRMVVRERERFHRVFDDFHHATDQIFADTSGAKAELKTRSNKWLQETLKGQWDRHSFPPVVIQRMSQMVFFPHISSPVPAAAASCAESLEGITPQELEARFPPLQISSAPGYSWVLSYNFNRVGAAAGSKKMARGGRFPEDGP